MNLWKNITAGQEKTNRWIRISILFLTGYMIGDNLQLEHAVLAGLGLIATNFIIMYSIGRWYKAKG